MSIQDQNGTCPLDLLKSSFGEYISDLLKKRKHIINAPNIFNVTPLISATFNCNHVKIEWLLNNGAIPNLKSTITPNDLFDSPGISFLKLYNNDGICYNSPITKKSEGISPLMVAMDDKSIDLLIKGGADIFELDDNGNSPFMLYIIRPWAFGALYLEKYISNKYDLRNYINYKNNNKQSSVYLFNKFCRNKWNERKFNPELIKLLEENSTWGWLDQFTQFRINFFKE